MILAIAVTAFCTLLAGLALGILHRLIERRRHNRFMERVNWTRDPRDLL